MRGRFLLTVRSMIQLKHLATACLAAVILALSLGACGGSGGKTASVQAGNMPEGQTWAGVYFHPVFGNLHLVEQDTNVIGKWQRTDKSAWGQLSGTKMGNVMHFEWTEHKYGLVGPAASVKGRGYFVYKVGHDNIGELHGEYGLGEDETGSTWDCVKQMQGKLPQPPDLDSITGETPGGGADDTGTGGGFH
jgi:hypothetical protein